MDDRQQLNDGLDIISATLNKLSSIGLTSDSMILHLTGKEGRNFCIQKFPVKSEGK